MKQIISLAIILMLAVSGVFAKDNNNVRAKLATVKGTNITVKYEQPSKNGRVLFGKPDENPALSYGKVWDESIEFTLTKDCLIGGNKKELKAGSYTLFVTPSQGEWVFTVNTDLNQNGIATYEKYGKKNILFTWALTKRNDHAVETFTITPKADGLLMEWDQVSVLLPVEFTK